MAISFLNINEFKSLILSYLIDYIDNLKNNDNNNRKDYDFKTFRFLNSNEKGVIIINIF